MLGRLCGVPVWPGLGVCCNPYGAGWWWVTGGFICGPPPAEAGVSFELFVDRRDWEVALVLVVPWVVCVGDLTRVVDSNGFEFVGVTGVTGLVGWLEEESGLSSLVLFFLRKFRLGI